MAETPPALENRARRTGTSRSSWSAPGSFKRHGALRREGRPWVRSIQWTLGVRSATAQVNQRFWKWAMDHTDEKGFVEALLDETSSGWI
jgi:hypothetical protein